MSQWAKITKDFGTFSAAHQLPGHDGKCANLHGHEYRVEATIVGLIQTASGSSEGMVLDFGIIKDIYKKRVDARLDHALILGTEPLPWVEWIEEHYRADSGYLDLSDEEFLKMFNEIGLMKTKTVARLPIPVTTAEWLSQWILGELNQGLVELQPEINTLGITVESVRVWETPTSMAEAIAGYQGPDW